MQKYTTEQHFEQKLNVLLIPTELNGISCEVYLLQSLQININLNEMKGTSAYRIILKIFVIGFDDGELFF